MPSLRGKWLVASVRNGGARVTPRTLHRLVTLALGLALLAVAILVR